MNDNRIQTRPIARKPAGFTLIEMLLVLAILSLLAAIVYPNLAQRQIHARITATETQIASIRSALQMFETENGYYPKGQKGLSELVEKPRDASSWHGPYLEEIPKDPWGHAYVYECPGKRHPGSYDIISAGPDGQLGNEDDIINPPKSK